MKSRICAYICAGVIFLGVMFLFLGAQGTHSSSSVLHLPADDIFLAIADTPAARERGLSGADMLAENSAMLFVFDMPDRYAFWMKDMKFPLDIIWLDPAFKIVDIKSNLSPETYPATFAPKENSLYVLEANAFFAEKNNLNIGDILNIDLHK